MARVSNLRYFQAPNQEELAELLKLGLPTKLGIRATVVVANPHFATVKFSKTFLEFFFSGPQGLECAILYFKKCKFFESSFFGVFTLVSRFFFFWFSIRCVCGHNNLCQMISATIESH